jgi:hypothetical protein
LGPVEQSGGDPWGGVELSFNAKQRDPVHYEMILYRFTLRVARIIVPNVFVDIGQGILELVEAVYVENRLKEEIKWE